MQQEECGKGQSGEVLKQDYDREWKLLDAVPRYILLFDCNGNIMTANRWFLAAAGLGRNEIAGMTLQDLEPCYPMQPVGELCAEIQMQGSWTGRTQLTAKNGQVLPVEQTCTFFEDETIKCIVSIGHDISELIREKEQQEARLRRAEQAVEAAGRMRSEFIANMNHEIRTPMNAIIGYSEMLAASELGERDQRYVKTICKNGATLISILNDVTELSKLESGSAVINKKSTDIRALVDEVTDQVTDRLSAENIDFSWTVQPDLPVFFMLDDNHCRQILTNLLSNAFKFTNRGRVTLAVTGEAADGDGIDLSFTVTDTGVGISAEEQKCLSVFFEQQEETIEHQCGGRLGLTLCARLARIMGGRISLSSEPGQGSCFVFSLPAEPVGDVERRTGDPGHHLQKSDNDAPPLLLVVDDMPMISAVIHDFFSSKSVEVLVADNSEDGLALARSRQPDLILMDLSLAGLDGRAVTRLLREDDRTAHIPVVVMTGRMLEEKDYTPLFDDFLAKPFHLHELQQLVERFIGLKEECAAGTLPAGNKYAQNELTSQIRASWQQDLAVMLEQALVSGSLDAAFTLGRRIFERGELLGFEQLTDLGRQLQDYAAGPDILGVEQLLAVLQQSTGERK